MFKLKNIDEQLKQEFQKLPLDYWDFKDADTRELTHGLHNYPAAWYIQFQNIISLVKKYQDVETILTPLWAVVPFCMQTWDLKAYMNRPKPLAILLSKVKLPD